MLAFFSKKGNGEISNPSEYKAAVRKTICLTPRSDPSDRVLSPSIAFEPKKPPAECRTIMISSPASISSTTFPRIAAISSCMVGLPGEVVPVLGKTAKAVLKPLDSSREDTSANGVPPSQKPGMNRIVGDIETGLNVSQQHEESYSAYEIVFATIEGHVTKAEWDG